MGIISSSACQSRSAVTEDGREEILHLPSPQPRPGVRPAAVKHSDPAFAAERTGGRGPDKYEHFYFYFKSTLKKKKCFLTGLLQLKLLITPSQYIYKGNIGTYGRRLSLCSYVNKLVWNTWYFVKIFPLIMLFNLHRYPHFIKKEREAKHICRIVLRRSHSNLVLPDLEIFTSVINIC